MSSCRVSLSLLALLATSSGCVLAPRAAREEQAAAARAGAAYAAPFAGRALPPVPDRPTWRDVVARALAANGELEAAYFVWAAAAHGIDRAGGYPDTAFALDVSRALSGSGSGLDRTAVVAGFAPMKNLSFPLKVYQAAKVQTAATRAAGERLVALRFDLQRRVLDAWLGYVLLAERLRIAEARLGLARLEVETAAAAVGGGGERRALIGAENVRLLAENEAAALTAELRGARARVNGLIAREPDAPLAAPAELEPPRPLPDDDARLLAVAARHDPELAVLAREVEGREDALALARLQYIPDVNPFVGLEGAAAQMVGVGISIPTLMREVGATVRAADAELAAARARLRQAGADRAAAVVAALVAARDAERRAALFAGPVATTVERAVATAEVAYAGATGTAADVLTARRQVFDVRLLVAEARIAREQAVAELEALLGLGAETLTAAAAAPDRTVAEVSR